MTAEDQRAWIHAATGCLALTFHALPAAGAVGLGVLLVLHNWLLLPRYLPGVVRGAPGRTDAGILSYPVAITLAIVLFRDRLELAAAVWGILAFGDGMASLVGRRVGATSLPWNPDKSWAGLVAFVVAGTLAGAGLMIWVQGGRGVDGVLSPDAASWPATLGWVAVAAFAAAGAESLRLRLDDNIRLVAAAAAVFWGGAAFDAGALASSPAWSRAPWVAGISAGLGTLAWFGASVDRSGLVVGILLATAVGTLAGPAVFLGFVAFFVLGSLATRAGRRIKERRGIAQARGGRRGAAHAIANVGVAAVLSLGVVAGEHPQWFLLGAVGALSTAAFDTVSSEIGQAWGRTTILPTTGRRVPPGTQGGVSLLGTAAGLAAAVAVAGVSLGGSSHGALGFGMVVAGALLGSTLESLAGATRQVRELLDSHALNFCNTAVGGGTAYALARWAGV